MPFCLVFFSCRSSATWPTAYTSLPTMPLPLPRFSRFVFATWPRACRFAWICCAPFGHLHSASAQPPSRERTVVACCAVELAPRLPSLGQMLRPTHFIAKIIISKLPAIAFRPSLPPLLPLFPFPYVPPSWPHAFLSSGRPAIIHEQSKARQGSRRG